MKNNLWTIKITITAFIVSFLFSTLSEIVMPKVNIYLSTFILVLFILIGIIFDMIGVAITTCDIKPFRSMSSKKIKYAEVGINLINNSSKVSSFCNDVIGDICGIISGSAGILMATTISSKFGSDLLLTSLIITSLIAAITIGGKSLGKYTSIKNNIVIVKTISKIIAVFTK